MWKVVSGITILIGMLSLIALVWIKATERKLGKIHRIIKIKKRLDDKVTYIIGVFLIFLKGSRLISGLVERNLDIYLGIECLSAILVAIMIIYMADVKIKVMDKGVFYKCQIFKKEDLLGIKEIEGALEVKYNMKSSHKTFKVILEKEDSKDVAYYLKKHFNIK